jgi:hypothetical protein
MTETILSFPVHKTAALSCVWIKTGNPAQPLVCKWVSQAESSDDPIPTEAPRPHHYQLCA